MATVPDSIVGKIEFGEEHVAPWTANAVAMGSSAPTITAWSAKVTAARAAYQAQKEAQNAAKAATNTLRLAMDALDRATSEVIQQVRTKAFTAGDAVYTLAEIPAPATPAPMPPPGTPSDLTVELDGDGALRMKFKCPNPPGASGTLYQVYRKDGPAEPFKYIGGSGVREYVDETVPAGATELTYKIQGVRSTSAGPWATFNVAFGSNVGGGGGGGASVTAAAAKAA